MDDPTQVEKKESEKNKGEYVRGIRGWLLVFIIFLGLYSWGWLSPTIREFSVWINRFRLWKLEYFLLSSFIDLFSIVTPLLLIYLLIGKKSRAVLFSKVFLILMPFVNVTNEYSFGIFTFISLDTVFYTAIFSLGICVTWLIYLNNSIRVANTYLITENKFPKVIDCPFCFERMRLDTEERIKKIAICPSCNATISKQSVIMKAE